MKLYALSALCLMVLISCFLADQHSDQKAKGRIFNGVETRQGDMPFVMKLLFSKENRRRSCTSFLIHPRWLLTAAHCRSSNDDMEVVINSPPETGRSTIRITQFFRTEEYAQNGTKWADIALVNVAEGINSSIRPVPIAIPSTSPWNRLLNTEGATATVAGYGLIDEHGTAARTLYKTYLFPENCDDPADFRMCFGGGPALESVCSGDSGGPVMTEESTSKLAFGVITAGSYSGCSNDTNRGPWKSFLYAVRITTHLDWIKETLCDHGDTLPYLTYTCP